MRDTRSQSFSRSRSSVFDKRVGNTTLIEILICLVIAAVVFFSIAGGVAGNFVDDNKVQSVLTSQGFKDVQIADKKIFFVWMRGCDASDSASYTVDATNPVGQRVRVKVCSGYWKGATIRSN